MFVYFTILTVSRSTSAPKPETISDRFEKILKKGQKNADQPNDDIICKKLNIFYKFSTEISMQTFYITLANLILISFITLK